MVKCVLTKLYAYPVVIYSFQCQVRPGKERSKLPNETPRLQQFSLSMEFNKRQGLRDELVFMI